MKFRLLLLGLVVVFSLAGISKADTLVADDITIVGSIIQLTSTATLETTSIPITIPNLLKLAAVPGTLKASEYRYYFDPDSNSGQGGFVVALKTNPQGVVVTTPLAFGADSVAWITNKLYYLSSAGMTGLDGNLSGTQYTFGTFLAKTAIKGTTIDFILNGTLNGLPAIMRGTLFDRNPSR
jgi:hypothetical protein